MTRKGLSFIILAFCLLALPVALNAQCKQFAKNTCKSGLKPYQHDGNYDATALLVEGDVAPMYKTVHSEVQYRLGVCGSNNLPPIHFQVQDARNGKVLYDNSDNDYNWKWDFTPESSSQIKVIITVPRSGNEGSEPEEGCVAVMFGATGY
jgi:hypothetical protein